MKRTIDSEQTVHPIASLAIGSEAIDKNDLLLRVGGDLEFLAELVTLFREDLPNFIIGIKMALRQRDVAEVARGAHALRGQLATLSAYSAAELAAEIECAAAAGDLSTADAAFSALETELLLAIDALSAICEERIP